MDWMQIQVNGMQIQMGEMQIQISGIQIQVNGVQTQMDGMQTHMEDRWQRIDQIFNSLETRINALNQNSASRAQNSTVAHLDRLFPLVNASTSENIPEFPETPAVLSRMTNATINRVLLALGSNTDGTIEVKRNRLSTTIGLRVGGV